MTQHPDAAVFQAGAEPPIRERGEPPAVTPGVGRLIGLDPAWGLAVTPGRRQGDYWGRDPAGRGPPIPLARLDPAATAECGDFGVRA